MSVAAGAGASEALRRVRFATGSATAEAVPASVALAVAVAPAVVKEAGRLHVLLVAVVGEALGEKAE